MVKSVRGQRERRPCESINGLYYWTWNTQEVLSMVEWMRIYNKTKLLQFTDSTWWPTIGVIRNLEVDFMII